MRRWHRYENLDTGLLARLLATQESGRAESAVIAASVTDSEAEGVGAYQEVERGPVFRVRDPDRAIIAYARFFYASGRLCFRETEATSGALTAYFFVEGERQILLDLGEMELAGELVTVRVGEERFWRLRPTR